jgi:hypothetical protein
MHISVQIVLYVFILNMIYDIYMYIMCVCVFKYVRYAIYDIRYAICDMLNAIYDIRHMTYEI